MKVVQWYVYYYNWETNFLYFKFCLIKFKTSAIKCKIETTVIKFKKKKSGAIKFN